MTTLEKLTTIDNGLGLVRDAFYSLIDPLVCKWQGFKTAEQLPRKKNSTYGYCMEQIPRPKVFFSSTSSINPSMFTCSVLNCDLDHREANVHFAKKEQFYRVLSNRIAIGAVVGSAYVSRRIVEGSINFFEGSIVSTALTPLRAIPITLFFIAIGLAVYVALAPSCREKTIY